MMDGFTLAVAQFRPVAGDVGWNTRRHVRLIKWAIEANAKMIIFPELSLTGYELGLAEKLAFSADDVRLDIFRELADQYGITIIVGAPVWQQSGKVGIGLLIFRPKCAMLTYCKMHLHAGEAEIFAQGEEELVFDCGGESIGLAICADTANSVHVANIAGKGATIYLCSMLITANGYAEDTRILSEYARQYKMLVAMANYYGDTGGWSAIGQSGIWNSTGALIGQAGIETEGLVVGVKKNGLWHTETIEC